MKSESIRNGALLQFAGLFLSAAAIGTPFLIPARFAEYLPKPLLAMLSIPALCAYIGLLVIGTVIRVRSRKPAKKSAVPEPQTLEITPFAGKAIRDSASAARAAALLMYLSVFLLALSALFLYIELPRHIGSTRSAVMGLDGLMLVLLAAIYAVPGRRIEKYADTAREIAAREEPLHEILAQQLTIWSYIGTVLIASSVMVTVGLAMEIVGGLL